MRRPGAPEGFGVEAANSDSQPYGLLPSVTKRGGLWTVKRRAIALGASLLLLGLLPGSVLALPPSNLDQTNLPASTSHVASGGNELAQT
jgi:hypothetical protein